MWKLGWSWEELLHATYHLSIQCGKEFYESSRYFEVYNGNGSDRLAVLYINNSCVLTLETSFKLWVKGRIPQLPIFDTRSLNWKTFITQKICFALMSPTNWSFSYWLIMLLARGGFGIKAGKYCMQSRGWENMDCCHREGKKGENVLFANPLTIERIPLFCLVIHDKIRKFSHNKVGS